MLIAGFPAIALFAVGLSVVLSSLKQLIWRDKRHPGRRRGIRFSARNVALGLAFLPFAILFQPSLAETAKAEIRQQEDADEDESGDAETPIKHLLRQLRRIRRGEQVETISLRLR
ncbi:MAG: hypothetical protein JST28_01020 [Acidobacteria bacterium]|nr:hypothetical protein [Acidobacteriota bacterium]